MECQLFKYFLYHCLVSQLPSPDEGLVKQTWHGIGKVPQNLLSAFSRYFCLNKYTFKLSEDYLICSLTFNINSFCTVWCLVGFSRQPILRTQCICTPSWAKQSVCTSLNKKRCSSLNFAQNRRCPYLILILRRPGNPTNFDTSNIMIFPLFFQVQSIHCLSA